MMRTTLEDLDTVIAFCEYAGKRPRRDRAGELVLLAGSGTGPGQRAALMTNIDDLGSDDPVAD